MRIAVADPPSEFTWENIGDSTIPVTDETMPSARWSYTFTPVEGGTEVNESWVLFDNPGLANLEEAQLQKALTRNQSGMEDTLAKLKALLDG